jgi:hypothetical protein
LTLGSVVYSVAHSHWGARRSDSGTTRREVETVPVIVFRVITEPAPFGEFVPAHGPPGGPGGRFFFHETLVLEEIDSKTPGHGLPTGEAERHAGTHSGIGTTLRYVDAGDPYFPGGGPLVQAESTFKLNAVGGALQGGQITTRGVQHYRDGKPVGEPTYAITGGTRAYANARGQLIAKEPVQVVPGGPWIDRRKRLEITM